MEEILLVIDCGGVSVSEGVQPPLNMDGQGYDSDSKRLIE